MYNLKNLPYTVIIMIKERIVTTSPPINIINHRGSQLKYSHFSIASIISFGKIVFVILDILAIFIILIDIPCPILSISSVISMSCATIVFAIANLKIGF